MTESWGTDARTERTRLLIADYTIVRRDTAAEIWRIVELWKEATGMPGTT
jgi:hypothetical protein